MTGPSNSPRGEHAGQPGTEWETELRPTGEHVVHDDAPQPQANRAARRAARKKQR